MHILFVAPHFPSGQRQFVRALHAEGAQVTGIGEAAPEHLDSELKSWLSGYEQVASVCDEEALLAAVRRIQRRGWVDRLEATIEAHILPTAHVRKLTGIPGLSLETAILCRDKGKMKAFLRIQGIPCAQSAAISSSAEALAFAQSVGYPLIVKPTAGAGASGTYRVNNEHELRQALSALAIDRGANAVIEEFISGHEGFYDTVSVGGEVVHEFISHYYPNVLEAMRTRWISPQIVTTNRLDAPGYDPLKLMGREVIRCLQIGTSATHMEWFYGPKGLKFSEIGARPPGVSQWDLYCAAHEIDLYRDWAHALTYGRCRQRPSHRYASGLIALRPQQDGRIVGYRGVQQIQEWFGPWIIDAHFPAPGSPTQPIEAGYMANAWIRMRHPNYDTLREMLNKVGETIQVFA